jgi:hypothetical protein
MGFMQAIIYNTGGYASDKTLLSIQPVNIKTRGYTSNKDPKEKISQSMRFQVLTTLNMNTDVFWDAASCSQ